MYAISQWDCPQTTTIQNSSPIYPQEHQAEMIHSDIDEFWHNDPVRIAYENPARNLNE